GVTKSDADVKRQHQHRPLAPTVHLRERVAPNFILARGKSNPHTKAQHEEHNPIAKNGLVKRALQPTGKSTHETRHGYGRIRHRRNAVKPKRPSTCFGPVPFQEISPGVSADPPACS